MTQLEKKQGTINDSDYSQTHCSFKNGMKTLREISGYDLYVSRAAFNHEGVEVAYVNEGMIGRIRIYIDGELVISRFPFCADFWSDTSFRHHGKDYRLITKLTNWITCAQEATLYVDGTEVGRKSDPRLGGLNWRQNLHLMALFVAIGLSIGFVISLLKSIL